MTMVSMGCKFRVCHFSLLYIIVRHNVKDFALHINHALLLKLLHYYSPIEGKSFGKRVIDAIHHYLSILGLEYIYLELPLIVTFAIY